MHIVITGVTRGLGRALAEWYIAHGHTVSGCGRSGQEIFDLRMTHPEPQAFEVVDVTQPVKVAIWAERVLGRGVPDLLINNAAVMNDPAPLWEISAEKFAQLMAINVNGVANVIRVLVPAMVERQRGVIVNLSSGWGRSVSPEVAPYCASKWAIEGLTKALAEELPPGNQGMPDAGGPSLGGNGGAVHPPARSEGQRQIRFGRLTTISGRAGTCRGT